MSESHERDFKGIWIPKEIWFDKRLSYFEKLLLAEIDSLDGPNRCYASNEYFAEFFNTNPRTVQAGISKLKKLGYISQVAFDGRTRFLGSNYGKITQEIFDQSGKKSKSTYENFDMSRMKKTPPLDREKPHPFSNNIYSIVDNKEESIAPKGAKVPSFFSNKRVKMTSNLYTKLIEDFGQSKIDEMVDRLEEYADINPKRFKEYANHATVIRKWIRDDLNKGKIKLSKNNIEEFLNKIKEKHIDLLRQGKIERKHNGIIFREGTYYKEFLFNEPQFIENVRLELAKMGRKI